MTLNASLRSAALAVAASSVVLTSAPAHAATFATVVGDVTIGCFGCGTYGPSGNDADFWITGIWNNRPVAARYLVDPPNATATFTVTETIGPQCMVAGSATGTITVDGQSASFTWTRIGTILIVSIPAPGATGVLSFTSVDPMPCGHRAVFHVNGTMWGT
jgi:hypothetical protein